MISIDPTTGLAAALAVLQTRLPRITKDKTADVQTRSGPGYRYNYSDLAQISAALLPLMGAVGLSFSARPTVSEGGRFVLAYELLHVSGESRSGEYPLSDRGSPQETGGQITYARRYCLCSVTGVAPDDDDDDAAAAQQAAARRQRRAARNAEPGEAADASRERGEPPMTGDQQRKMQALFRDVGLDDRDEKLRYAVGVVERPLTSSTELTRGEASRVIDKLAKWAAQSNPPSDQAADPSGDPPAQPGGAS